MDLSVFSISQLLVGVAIGFDLLSFQFKERRPIIACLVLFIGSNLVGYYRYYYRRTAKISSPP